MKKIILILLTIFLIFLYYFFSDSYRLSLEAKVYYEMEDYNKAYTLAKEAYKIKPYNNMAFAIMTQSRIAKEWIAYIKEADGYFEKISKITSKQNITKSDKVRIKLMLEILINQYPYLKDSYLLKQDLIQKTENRYLKAKEIYEKVFATRSN